jgi:serine palmitoyltransferase
VIDSLRIHGHGSIYSETMSPALTQQAISALKIVMGRDGSDSGKKRLAAIAENSIYFHRKLKSMGFIVYGMEGSPVIPLLIFHPAKLP